MPGGAGPGDGSRRAGLTARERVLLARENLTLAMSLFAAAHQGLITAAFVAPAPEATRWDGERAESWPAPELADGAALRRCLGNQLRGAFVVAVLQTYRELTAIGSEGGIGGPPDADFKAAGEAMYLLAQSVEGNLLAPVWAVPAEYRRRLEVAEAGFALDGAVLHGQEIRWEHFGGLPRLLDLMGYVADRLGQAGEGIAVREGGATARGAYGPVGELAELPTGAAPPAAGPVVRRFFGGGAGRLRHPGREGAEEGDGWIAPEGIPQPRITVASQAWETGSIADFVESACATGEKAMSLAGELYTSYARWCLENGYLAVSQRKFGLELTSSGYRRKRRGKGRHWWLGLEPREKEGG